MSFGLANFIFLIVNTLAIFLILLIYLITTRSYLNHQVPFINSSNLVINSTDVNKVIRQFQIMFNLTDYEIIYTGTDNMIKVFKNINKNKKQIIISKRIFESVGYELDYLISRLWISAKQVKKDSLLKAYKLTILTIPTVLIIMLSIFMLGSIFLFAYNTITNIFEVNNLTTNQNNMNINFLYKLWKYMIFNYLSFSMILCLFINYYISIIIKNKIELYYNDEVSKLASSALEIYEYDFKAARIYALSIKWTYIPVFKINNFWTNHYKWTGPFTIV
ncbi:hypothetical protein FOY66_03060 [Mycoplasma capricolum subsp. capripneumoniae]|uniref:Membrane protein n=1 Tax=Mycoplasma capricolum subsp. capripneumoniae 87001 TaxID=1124992 RepID=A0A9N7G8T9_MYCCC|nr:hypothetical protein [Mycoplasma capricolum]AJK51620.1 membrane protein [Mycoplasma capricolum subsp. capripneumoniae 87001]AQU77609.1 hypothetical protein BVA24_03085 [Mycoplasma capricolum subsp. capripneumoniae]QDL19728.1 hypothetical protein DQW15_03075 [Mycoplasma capricolum subsp. capripneumoniae]QDL20413.1 hypothetical protein DQW16_03075 [Mycoplasma capricolum subsp. capripneumoniae]QDL21100.1 hypothetical protein DQW17_03075 [Mycoplasma capricolum subsp. capripneumoniae]